MSDCQGDCARCQQQCNVDSVTCKHCNGSFHYSCAGVRETVYRKWDESRKSSWKCSRCQNAHVNKPASTVPVLSLETSQNNVKSFLKANARNNSAPPTDIVPELYSLKSANIPEGEKMAQLFKIIEGLVESVQFQSTKYDESLNQISIINEKMAVQHKKLVEQEMKIECLTKENSKLVKMVNNIDQCSRAKNIEIHGVQHREGENVGELVQDLAQQLHIKMELKNIETAHRMPPSKNKTRGPIIVKFNSRQVRNEFIQKRNTGLISNNIVRGSDNEKVYVNVNLCPKYKELFWKARKTQKELNYKYCWVGGNGDIFLQRNENTKRLLIRGEEDLPQSTRNGNVESAPNRREQR